MRTHVYEHLTIKENGLINSELNRIENLLKKGLITHSEASYMFQESMMEKFPKQAFNICTNRDDFIK